ncbi:MAG: FixH family protein [Candidatus Marinimicrobia bacterium]|nr:FixH family protein [Candidatus Neomarinimicrobiota bacterium]
MADKPNIFFRVLVIVITLFMVLNVAFVIYTHTLSFGLVSENYYADELAYQDQIDRIERTNALPQPVKVKFSPASGVMVSFPVLFEPATVEGTIKLFRPSDKRLDRRFPISLNREGVQYIPAANLPVPGLWKVKIFWQSEGIEYYLEEELILQY